MKNLTLTQQVGPLATPEAGYLNLYVNDNNASNIIRDNLTSARGSRNSGPGICLRITRDMNGDFTIEKIEEF